MQYTIIPCTLSIAGSEGRAGCASLLCMLYNTAAMAAAKETAAIALMTAGCAALLGCVAQ